MYSNRVIGSLHGDFGTGAGAGAGADAGVDTGISPKFFGGRSRVSELCNLKLQSVWLEGGILKAMGKGNKERLIPIGKQIQRLLWHYINRYRPELAMPNYDFLFLTREGGPLTKDRVEKFMVYYGKKAGLKEVRCYGDF